MATRQRGRPSKLTAEVAERLVFAAGFGGSVEAAARSAGVAPRTVGRWREHGRRELDALSAEARFELAIGRAEEHVRALSWEETARRLDADFGSGWSPLDDDLD